MAEMKDQKMILKKVFLRIRPYRFGVIFSLILATVYVIMTLYIPILVGKAIDCILEPGKVYFEQMGTYLLSVAACTAAASLARWIMTA